MPSPDLKPAIFLHHSSMAGGVHDTLHAKADEIVAAATKSPRNASIYIELKKSFMALGESAQQEGMDVLSIRKHQRKAVAPYNKMLKQKGVLTLIIDPQTTEPDVPNPVP